MNDYIAMFSNVSYFPFSFFPLLWNREANESLFSWGLVVLSDRHIQGYFITHSCP